MLVHLCIALVAPAVVLTAATHAVADDHQTKSEEKEVDLDDNFDGKVFTGYQGWFNAEGDDFPNLNWRHYANQEELSSDSITVDMWPDMSEYDDDEKYPTQFKKADGSTAYLFSSANEKTTKRHFGWMKEYGIDGAFMQRFAVSTIDPNVAPMRQRVLDNVRAASAEHEVDYAVMYDLSGLKENQLESVLIDDWKMLVDQGVTKDETYLTFHGKPVVSVWGIGFSDNRPYTLEECKNFIEFLKNDPEYGGNAVMVGVPYWWRDLSLKRDTMDDPMVHEIIEMSDIVLPWAVGRYRTAADADRIIRNESAAGDVEWLEKRGITYMPLIFPGFSWRNMKQARGQDAPPELFNQIPREGGNFFWSQAMALHDVGAKTIYVAMFDEVDEATAIFKTDNNPPVGDEFVTFDEPSDHYLWLTGEIGRVLRGERKATEALPERDE